MPLSLKITGQNQTPVELDGLVPDLVQAISTHDVAKLPCLVGNRRASVGDVFTVEGSAADGVVRLAGDLTCVHRIGAKMRSGRMIVDGDVGMHAGAEMAGGELIVEGSAGTWLGAQMHDGKIRCRGCAGDGAGAAYPGQGRGMTGGTIVIDGDAGAFLGRRMRRGMIAVGGNAGDSVGAELLAGTIIVRGTCTGAIGTGMRRGTIIVLGKVPQPLPTFVPGGIHRPVFVRMIARHLEKLGVSWGSDLLSPRYQCRHGDILQLGRGELLERVAG